MNKIKLLIIDDNKNLVDMIREYFKDKNTLYSFLLKVPIIDDFDEGVINHNKNIDMNKLNYYIERNTYPKGIRLIRRYYGIVAKK